MLDFLMQYGLFLAKTLTLFIVIIATFFVMIMIIIRAKSQAQDGTFTIENINDRIDEITELLESEMLSKTELKARAKARKENEAEIEEKIKKNPLAHRPKLFILNFDGDIKASQVSELRETITAVINVATQKDEVLVILESGGGFVPHYGLAASQLSRFRERDIPLTIAIDKIAASGGYLMACVANKIISAPFAIVGSIGVIGQLPNFHRLLEKHNIDYEEHTAGKYKRSLTMFGKNNNEAREKFKEELADTHIHFKDFIARYRPQVNLEQTATGEHWYGEKAKTLKLVDDIQTSDDYILEKHPEYQIYEVSFVVKMSLKDKLASSISSCITSSLLRTIEKLITKLSSPGRHTSL